MAIDLANMKQRMKTELEETNFDFQRQLLKLDTEIKELKDLETALGEQNSKTHAKEHKLTATLTEWKNK